MRVEEAEKIGLRYQTEEFSKKFVCQPLRYSPGRALPVPSGRTPTPAPLGTSILFSVALVTFKHAAANFSNVSGDRDRKSVV